VQGTWLTLTGGRRVPAEEQRLMFVDLVSAGRDVGSSLQHSFHAGSGGYGASGQLKPWPFARRTCCSRRENIPMATGSLIRPRDAQREESQQVREQEGRRLLGCVFVPRARPEAAWLSRKRGPSRRRDWEPSVTTIRGR